MEKVCTKKIAVDAYFMNNLGDDLFLDILVSRYSNCEFDFITPDLKYAKYFKNNSRVNNISEKYYLKNIKMYDAYITIGGSLFQQPKKWIRLWGKYLIKIMATKLNKKKTFLLGCNFGPYNSSFYLSMYRAIFRFIDFVTVRDEKSFALLKNNKENVHQYPDIVFCYKDKIEETIKKKDIIGISVMDFGNNRDENNYEKSMLEIINTLSKSNQLRLFSFQDSPQISDLKVLNRLLKNIENKKNIEIISYDGDLESFLLKFQECTSFLSTRFHSMILSIISFQNVVAINYNIKIENTINSLDLDIPYFDIENISSNINMIVELLTHENKRVDKENIQKQRDIAESHFKQLDKVIGILKQR